jgi:hypothetical protein
VIEYGRLACAELSIGHRSHGELASGEKTVERLKPVRELYAPITVVANFGYLKTPPA